MKWFIKMKRCVLKSLQIDIPTFLLRVLESYLRKECLYKNLRITNQKTLDAGLRVYDIINCGPRNQFALNDIIAHNCLGLDYGLYPYSLYIDWLAQGYDVTEEDCWNVFNGYWAKYAGLKEWEKELLEERDYRGGWVMNSFGHPVCIEDGKVRDIINTVTQNSGHAVLMVLNKHVRDQIHAAGIKSHRPVIQDFHDETIRTCREDEAEKMVEAMSRAMDRLNDELQPDIPFSGTPEIGRSIWDFKK